MVEIGLGFKLAPFTKLLFGFLISKSTRLTSRLEVIGHSEKISHLSLMMFTTSNYEPKKTKILLFTIQVFIG